MTKHIWGAAGIQKNQHRQTNKSGTHCEIILDLDADRIKDFCVICLLFTFFCSLDIFKNTREKENQLLVTEIRIPEKLWNDSILLDIFEQLIEPAPFDIHLLEGWLNPVPGDRTLARFCFQPGRNSYTKGSGTQEIVSTCMMEHPA